MPCVVPLEKEHGTKRSTRSARETGVVPYLSNRKMQTGACRLNVLSKIPIPREKTTRVGRDRERSLCDVTAIRCERVKTFPRWLETQKPENGEREDECLPTVVTHSPEGSKR